MEYQTPGCDRMERDVAQVAKLFADAAGPVRGGDSRDPLTESSVSKDIG
jgi:hypothetical protein